MRIKIFLLFLTMLNSKLIKTTKKTNKSNSDELCLRLEKEKCLQCSDSVLNTETGKCEVPEKK